MGASSEAVEVRWLFESGGLLLRFTGYELRRFRPGARHDWLSGSADLWLTFSDERPGEEDRTVAQLRAFSEELSIGADELEQLRGDLEELIAGRTSTVTFAPFERDVELTIEYAERDPRIGLVMRCGLGVTTLDPQPTTLEALRRACDALADVLGQFPQRG